MTQIDNPMKSIDVTRVMCTPCDGSRTTKLDNMHVSNRMSIHTAMLVAGLSLEWTQAMSVKLLLGEDCIKCRVQRESRKKNTCLTSASEPYHVHPWSRVKKEAVRDVLADLVISTSHANL